MVNNMNVLRVAPYPLEVSFDVPSPSVEYTLKVIDSIDGTTESTTITSGVNSKLEYPIGMDRLRFDREFEVQVYEADDIVAEDHLSIVRPYVDPKALATGATDIVEYTKYEVIARAIIDGIIKHGFYNRKHILQGEGEGTDVFPSSRFH